jgi:hypothetical protein
MFVKFFSTTEVDTFADWVLLEVEKSLPPASRPSAKIIEQRVDRLEKQLQQQTHAFCRSVKLNVYKKARLMDRVREGLRSLHYPEPFIKSFTYDLVRRIRTVSDKQAASRQ